MGLLCRELIHQLGGRWNSSGAGAAVLLRSQDHNAGIWISAQGLPLPSWIAFLHTVPEMSTALSLKELSSKGLQVVPYEQVKLDKAQRKIKRLSFIIQILRQLLMGFVGNINISGRKIGNDGETVLLISSYLFSFGTCTQFFQIFHY